MTIRFEGRVAIVTGGGGALGRSHCLALAERGARVVVNEMPSEGVAARSHSADEVVELIRSRGGEAIAFAASITDEHAMADMVAKAQGRWGRIDILVNNAAILRDKSFHRMTMDEFRDVVEVDLNGYAACTKAVWDVMRSQSYGRIVLTTSSSGLYGSFGQANYSAAKMALVGLMNTLHLEGAKYDIRVNTLAPTARSAHTEALGLPEEALDLLSPEAVSAALVFLVSEDAPSRAILCAGAGGYARTLIYETEGVYLEPASRTPENVAARFADISSPSGQVIPEQGADQATKFLTRAFKHGHGAR